MKIFNRIKSSSLSKLGTYSLFKIAAYLISIISMPVMTREFSVTDYGTISLMESTITLVVSFCLVGLPQAYIRYYEIEKKEGRIKIYDSSTNFLVLLILCITFVISFLIIRESYGDWLALIIAVIIALTVSNQQLLSFIRARGKLYLHAVLTGSNEIGTFLVPLMGVLFIAPNINTYFLCKLLVCIVYFFIIIGIIKPSITRENIELKVLKELLMYGMPLLLLSVGSTIYSNGDRVVINLLYGEEMVAYYSVPAKLSHALQQILIYPISMVIFPQYISLWEKSGEKKTKEYLNKGLKLYIFIICPIIMGAIIIRKDLILFLSDARYLQADYLVPILVISLLVYGIYYFIASGFFLKNKTLMLGLVMGGTALINIVLNFLLGYIWGLLGIGIATAIAYLLFLFICSKISNKIINLTFPVKNTVVFLFKALIMFLVLKIINIQMGSSIMNIIFNVILGGGIYFILNIRYIKTLIKGEVR